MSTRGCMESDFETIADFLLRAAQITVSIQREYGKFQKDFIEGLKNNKDIYELRNRVETFASQFEMPGYD
ncbi:serine hydroxymethyltransferase 7 [Pyrus ussuriensis x Pyrus communis]|uniref:Serine hydroxymethyltransferase 7 n=1 Tax=Pyrus ussuriensis x Pyrus communis TaxID=2448454 RepID=A0A5N5HQE0_9ROSA|nr:serine hydroxymethyltransferase 7 [Pyrus ussuriensis x Pyrus communis]